MKLEARFQALAHERGIETRQGIARWLKPRLSRDRQALAKLLDKVPDSAMPQLATALILADADRRRTQHAKKREDATPAAAEASMLAIRKLRSAARLLSDALAVAGPQFDTHSEISRAANLLALKLRSDLSVRLTLPKRAGEGSKGKPGRRRSYVHSWSRDGGEAGRELQRVVSYREARLLMRLMSEAGPLWPGYTG